MKMFSWKKSMRKPLIVFGYVVSVGFIFSLLRLRLLPGITGHRSRFVNNNIRDHKQNQHNEETIRPGPRLIIKAARPDCVWFGIRGEAIVLDSVAF